MSAVDEVTVKSFACGSVDVFDNLWICRVKSGGTGHRFVAFGESLHLSVVVPSKAGIVMVVVPNLIEEPWGV